MNVAILLRILIIIIIFVGLFCDQSLDFYSVADIHL